MWKYLQLLCIDKHVQCICFFNFFLYTFSDYRQQKGENIYDIFSMKGFIL